MLNKDVTEISIFQYVARDSQYINSATNFRSK